jgi:hypothetical protein
MVVQCARYVRRVALLVARMVLSLTYDLPYLFVYGSVSCIRAADGHNVIELFVRELTDSCQGYVNL